MGHGKGFKATLVISLLAVASAAMACGSAGKTATSSPEYCDDVQADIGGCGPDRPVYEGTTCDAVAGEWGDAIERLIVPIFGEPPLLGDKQKSARVHDALVLATVTAGLHMDEAGMLGTCTSADFIAIAEPGLGQEFRDGIDDALYDAAPIATWDQFLFELERVIRVIDVAAPSGSHDGAVATL